MTAPEAPVPFLSNTPARPADRRVAWIVVVCSLLVCAMVVPFVQLPLAPVPGFIPAYEAALILNDLITAILLFTQFRQLRTPSLLILGSGYLFDALVVTAHALSFPGAFSEAGLLGGHEQTAPWLYVWWHTVFPISVLAYAMIAHRAWDRPIDAARVGGAIVAGVLVAIALAGTVIVLATVLVDEFKIVLTGQDYSRKIGSWAGFFALAGVLPTATLWYRTRARTVLDLWLLVVMIAWMLDILLSSMLTTARYQVGWYAGRLYGLMAASFVLGALLVEAGDLYGRLIRSLAEARARADALAQSQEQLRHAQKMEAMGQLTGGVAHDFNNLLTIIVGNLDLITRHADDVTRVRRLTAAAQRAAARGGKLTQQLLVFARRQLLRPETLNPNRLLLDFEGLMRRAVGEPVRVELALDPALDPVRIDPSQFEAAVLNLVINARDAMPSGGGITITTRNVALGPTDAAAMTDARPGAYAVIAVHDTGSGIPANLLAKVFEPFFTTKEVGKGSGLGLSQVYGFVKESGGHVRIDSAEGRGTTVELWLPRSTERASEPTDAGAASRMPLRAATGGEVVLVVEDDDDVRALASEALGELGYHTVVAHDAAAALTVLRDANQRIDILFSDVVMPGGMNGAQLAVEARRLRPALRVLLTSGYTADALSSEHGVDGADAALLRKPYRTEDLAAQLRVVLGGRA